MADGFNENKSHSRSKMFEESAFELQTEDIASDFSEDVKLPKKSNQQGVELAQRMDEINKRHVDRIEAKIHRLRDEDASKLKESDISSGDIRYKIACNNAVAFIRIMEAEGLKSGYEDYSVFIGIVENVRFMLILCTGLIIIMSKPDWCEFTPYVSSDCRRSTMPGEDITYPLSNVPMIFENIEKKVLILILSSIVILINLTKISICTSSERDRNSFKFCLSVVLVQFGVFFLNIFNVSEINLFDILTTVSLIFSVPQLQETLFKFLGVLSTSKEIIMIIVLFILMFTLSSQVFFYDVSGFTDGGGDAFFGYDFSGGFIRTLYTVSITTLIGDNMHDICAFLTGEFKIGVLFFLPFSLIATFFLTNFMMGIMYYYYTGLFDTDVLYIEESYSNLSSTIKQNIANETLSSSTLKQMVEINFLKGNLDINMYEIDKFYKKTGDIQNFYDDYEDNPHNVKNFLIRFTNTFYYTVTLGVLDALKIIVIVFCIDTNTKRVLTIQLIATAINIVLAMDSLIRLTVMGFKWKITDFLSLLSLTFICVTFGYLCINAAIYDEFLWIEYFTNNQHYIRLFCLLTVLTSYRCLSLLAYNDQIKTVAEVVFKSLPLISDILSIIFITIFFYASIGLVLFGGVLKNTRVDVYFANYGGRLFQSGLLLNFNDFISAMLSLLTIMFGGWVEIAKTNSTGMEARFMEHFFYISFFVITKMCFLNIIFGFLINNCQLYLQEKIMNKQKKDSLRRMNTPSFDPDLNIHVEHSGHIPEEDIDNKSANSDKNSRISGSNVEAYPDKEKQE